MWLLSFLSATCSPFLMLPLTVLSVLSSCALRRGAWLLGCIDQMRLQPSWWFTLDWCLCARTHTHTGLYAGAHVYISMWRTEPPSNVIPEVPSTLVLFFFSMESLTSLEIDSL